MSSTKRILRPLGLALAGAGALLALGFVDRSVGRAPIAAMEVRVHGAEGVHFIDETGVRQAVLGLGSAVIGAPGAKVDLAGLEQRLGAIPCVAEAQAFRDLDGVLHVSVRQREPLIRVINADGSGFYIDAEGYAMPLGEGYTARVPVATGWLREPGAAHGVIHVQGHDSLVSRYRSDDLYRLALLLHADPLWSALIDQVVVGADGQMELVPTVGAQRILIGDGTRLEQRLAKLRLFYQEALPKADWRRYGRIDLRFSDQIVCTKRTNPNQP